MRNAFRPTALATLGILLILLLAGVVAIAIGAIGFLPVSPYQPLGASQRVALVAAGFLVSGISLVQFARQLSLGVCQYDGTDLYLVGKPQGLYVCCSAAEQHCWKL
jgi:multisubunit Na+/H+ antiporter MnhG subunit